MEVKIFLMKNNKISLLVFLAVFIIIVGCKAGEKEPVAEAPEEVVDSGSLIIESSPSSAQVYVGEGLKGETPITIYNLPVGEYDITVKKDGYADFKKTVAIRVGKIEEVDVTLASVAVGEAKPIIREPEKEANPENVTAPDIQLNKIDLSSFAMYLDLESQLFTEIRTENADIFSRKYDTYVHFTALTPAKINVINEPLKDVAKEDCIFSDIAIATLFSGQTLCVKTMEGAVFALSWQASPNEMELKLLS